MESKELKKLRRTELLEMLIAQSIENENLKNEIADLKMRLESREINIRNSGSIAEAALKINGIFEAAEASSAQYIENIKNTEKICKDMREDAEREAADILEKANREAEETTARSQQLSSQYWNEVSAKLGEFYEERPGLLEALSQYTEEKTDE